MIPRADITAWSERAPWSTSAQIEQDLIISRALIELFSNKKIANSLAFRGGTALHKLLLEIPMRYSEDIDLIQVVPEPIGDILSLIRESLMFLGLAEYKKTSRDNTLVYRFETEIEPVLTRKLRIEINCREHDIYLLKNEVEYMVSTQWFKGKCLIPTFTIEELLGTKLRALYQRRKGRDLFDIWHTLTHHKIDINKMFFVLKRCLIKEGNVISEKDFMENVNAKVKHPDFRNDVAGMLRPEFHYNVDTAWEVIQGYLQGKFNE